ncbi:MAG: carbohydrate ABC transporter permease [Clostridiales bacterium]|nr:carbohydrate ABC transporter permease [Clostridiales bacterium]
MINHLHPFVPAKKRHGKRRATAFDVANYALMVFLGLCFLYPIWYCIITSISSADAISRELPMLWPNTFSLSAYHVVLSEEMLPVYYRNSIFYAFVGTVLSLVLTSMMAYPFVIPDFKGKTLLNIYMVITMFFSGGLLPTFYLITSLGLRNTIWVMLLPGAVGAYNTIVFRTFFKSIPSSLSEAACIDGASHYRVLFLIILPLSKSLLATFGLFGVVGRWNDWFTPFLYLTRKTLQPIQLYLRSVLVVASYTSDPSYQIPESLRVVEENLKCAIVLITIGPILLIYPFLQKYFVKGVMVGAIKA